MCWSFAANMTVLLQVPNEVRIIDELPRMMNPGKVNKELLKTL